MKVRQENIDFLILMAATYNIKLEGVGKNELKEASKRYNESTNNEPRSNILDSMKWKSERMQRAMERGDFNYKHTWK